ncbi:MAG TPA: hypothetical protein EYQ81_05500 [Sneathiellales bacterium]|nr:hypothetical protein [Sneathiellales bacterium]
MAFKQLTPENWDEHDSTGSVFVLIDKNGVDRTPMGSEWARMILEPKLSQTVPSDVVEMFEVARGILVYGWFFYPLFTAGIEQLFLVHDSAIAHRCDELSAPKKIRSFAKRIEWLSDQGDWTVQRKTQWTAARSLRNDIAHKKQQSIFDPTMAVRNVNTTIELINELFGDTNITMR